MRIILQGLAWLAAIIAVVVYFRTPFILAVMPIAVPTPPLLDKVSIELGSKERWHDDYFTIEALDSDTYVISEPRYYRDPHMYLLVGSHSALLIDSGSPHRDLRPVVQSLTDKPVFVIATHLHFDHVGNHDRFSQIIMPDVAGLRQRLEKGTFRPKSNEYLGSVEKFERSSWPVFKWLQIGDALDLGGRKLVLLSTPGHTPESVSIHDPARDFLFMGDYAGDGEIYAFMPNSSLQGYLDTTVRLIDTLPSTTKILAGHGGAETAGAPITEMASLVALRDGLIAVRNGEIKAEGGWPRQYRISPNLVILTDWNGPGSVSWDFE